MLKTLYALAAISASVAAFSVAASRTQNFDSDPNWEGVHNRVVPEKYPTVTQDFGYSGKTNFAGKAQGEMGGMITRASEPAFYAEKIAPKTLDDKLSASGTFALTKTTGGAGMFFGFFNADQPGASGRPIASLGLDMDCENTGARLAVRLITGRNQSCGTFVTPFIPGKFRPTPIRNDGKRYTWKLDYDPQGAGGRGQFTFTIHGDAPKPGELVTPDLNDAARQEARARFPDTTTFTVDLPEGYKQQGTTFDHFGVMNMMKAGGQMSIYFDDLTCNGTSQDFSADPKWDQSGNRKTYQASDVGGAHNFGFSGTANAGGKAGEIGGTFWRGDKWGYYADKVEPLSFDDRLEAHGKVVLAVGGPDADMCFGWFRSDGVDHPSPDKAGDFIGVHVGGPTRVGHYFVPAYAASENVHGVAKQGPVMKRGKSAEWSIVYDPTANDGNGAIATTLDGETATLNLKPEQRRAAKDAHFDHFGLFSIGPGGQIVKLYLDDVTYTVSRP